MRVLGACLLIAAAALAQSPETKPAHPSLVGFGLSYQLSTDWVLATSLMRKAAEARNQQSDSVVLAAVYVPHNKTMSVASPFFSLLAFHHKNPDCQQFLDTMAQQLEKEGKAKITRAKLAFSAGGRDFYRTDFEQNGVLHRRSLICTTAEDYVLAWNAGARDEKGLDAVVSTVNSLTAVPAAAASDGPAVAKPEPEGSGDDSSTVHRVQVALGVMRGLIVKRVQPVYPQEARADYIQGTVLLSAEISKEGDIVNLELLEGPIELVGSAIDAVRQWKYRPYTLNGEAVSVKTQIQVNYQLR